MAWSSICRVHRLSAIRRPFSIQNSVRGFSVRGSALNQNEATSSDTGASPELPQATIPKPGDRGRTIFSGIQPTGVPHLGNYLGALQQWKQYQDKKAAGGSRHETLIFSIVDLHALTHPQRPEELFKSRMETMASLLAIGLDRKYSSIYFQSSILGHTKMMWYLSNVASAGYLSRMTQWKSKLGVPEDATLADQTARKNLRLGLFSYPVLQAADILLYNADLVPVGEDQKQHVEFARSLARSFNAQYKEANGGKDFFTEPTVLLSPAKRIMSLTDPIVKMSKSHSDPNSRILITDSAEVIQQKLKGALTDSIEGISFDHKTRPGVSNLIEILKHTSKTKASCEDLASDLQNQSMRALKEHVADSVIKCLDGIRDQYHEIMDPRNTHLQDTEYHSTKKVGGMAGNTLKDVEKLMGMSRFKHLTHLSTDAEAQRSRPTKSSLEKKERILREQEQAEKQNESEPDVTPQLNEGVDRPIAS